MPHSRTSLAHKQPPLAHLERPLHLEAAPAGRQAPAQHLGLAWLLLERAWWGSSFSKLEPSPASISFPPSQAVVWLASDKARGLCFWFMATGPKVFSLKENVKSKDLKIMSCTWSSCGLEMLSVLGQTRKLSCVTLERPMEWQLCPVEVHTQKWGEAQ